MKTFLDALPKYANLLLQVIILLGLFYLYQRQEAGTKANREYWEGQKGKKFKTDTVIVKIDYDKLPRPIFKNIVPPATVYEYPDEIYQEPQVVLTLNDSLLQVIDSLSKRIVDINPIYLKRHPEAPKLLYGVFTSDSLTLDLLDITGGINRFQYGVNYERFHYQWVNGELRADKIPFNTFKRKFSFDAYANAGYDWISSKPLLGTDASLNWGKFKLKGQSWVTIENQPKFNLQTTLGFKIR